MTSTTVQVIETTNTIQIVNEHNVIEIPQTDYVIEVTSPGPQGKRGTVFLSGNGLPTSDVGVDGDFYIDLDDSSAVYGPKVGGVWPATPTGRFSQFTLRHTHTQTSPSATWTITHELGGKPSVTVVDSANSVVVGEVTYVDNETVRIEFSGGFSGYAYLT